MPTYPLPEHETERMAKLREFAVLDSIPQDVYDRVTRLAARLLDAPIAVASLIDEDRQWFKACSGVAASNMPREWSFCAHAICQHEVFVIEDASRDERFSNNPFVTGEPGLRFYAGAPLTASGGLNMGTLSVLDTRPRTITDDQKRMLADLAAMIMDSLETRLIIDQEERTKIRFIDAMESLPTGFVMYDRRDRLVACNQRYRAMLPRVAEFIVEGVDFESILRRGVDSGQFPEAAGDEENWIARLMRDHQAPGARHEHALPGNRWIAFQERRTSDGGIVGFSYDITEIKKQERQLAQLAWTDSLTGCMNRHRFMELASIELERTRRSGGSACLMLLDADHFKQINDRNGHAAGDEVLKGLVQRWHKVLRSHDLIGRVGGEEFCVLLPDAGIEAASALAERLRASVADLPFHFEGQLLRVTVSLGVAALAPGDDLNSLMRRADVALYEAKEAGRDRFIVKAA
ncbi:diguanylate cyclase [Hoeflea alexandrii]|uniref:diguanylate cyclase n=1 Tax=Hoeflea alexandrii TaxID=288436 RepID=UPI0022B05E7C|nr:diguanylate cyclase [Hoeflea alexandrii]